MPTPLRFATHLCPCLVALALAAPAGACDRSTLAAFAPESGEVLLGKRLPSTEEVVRRVQVLEQPAECGPDEPDPTCVERLGQEYASLAAPGQTLTVDLEGPTAGVYGVMMGTEGKVDGLFGSHAELATFLESVEAREQELALQMAEPALDRDLRVPMIRVVEQVREMEPRPPGLRVLYRPVGSSLEALETVQRAADAASIEVVAWLPRDDGTVAIDLRCVAD